MNRDRVALILFLAAFGAFAYFEFLQKDPMDQPVSLNGRNYALSETVKSSGVKNYFFTENGEEFESATEFIQFIVFEEEIPEETRRSLWGRLARRYGLEETPSQSGNYFGTSNRRGVSAVSYGAQVTMDSGLNYTAYVKTGTPNFDLTEARSQSSQLIDELRTLPGQLTR